MDLPTYVLLIVGFLLLNFFMQRAAQRARQRQQEEQARLKREAGLPEGTPPEAEPPESGSSDDIWGRRGQSAPPAAEAPKSEPEDIWGRRGQSASQPAAPAIATMAVVPALPLEAMPRPDTAVPSPSPSAHRAPAQAFFRSREELRHAVVVMTVLGPCRALDPHDRSEGGPAAGSLRPPSRS